MKARRWQDWVNLILGVWLFISPWLLAYSDVQSASWNGWILGIALVVFSAIAVSMPQAWEEVINILLGIWLIISPWVLGFSATRSAETNDVIVGILAIVFAAWAIALDRQQAQAGHPAT